MSGLVGIVLLCGFALILFFAGFHRKSFEEHKRAIEEQICKSGQEVRESQLSIPLREHLDLARAALEDLLGDCNLYESWVIAEQEGALVLSGPGRRFVCYPVLRHFRLRGSGKLLSSLPRWAVCPDRQDVREFETLNAALLYIESDLRQLPVEPEHRSSYKTSANGALILTKQLPVEPEHRSSYPAGACGAPPADSTNPLP